MVRTNDEQQPEAAPLRITSGNQEPAANPNDAPRLTPIPRWLMHWWTPLVLSALTLAIGTPIAFWWGGHFHWPSSGAMTLCATLAGAAFTFSAWQQRSHDNAARAKEKLDHEHSEAEALKEQEQQRMNEEKRRIEQIERDEYWKRREQIFQLLGSENPGLRLGAIALLAELADMTSTNNLIPHNDRAEFQQHIINTLCSQMRHEGLLLDSEGSLEEHSSIQAELFRQLNKRITDSESPHPIANWQTYTIDLSHTNFYTPITLSHINTSQILNLSHSIFHRDVSINKSKILNLIWSNSTHLQQLSVSLCTLHMDHFPSIIRDGKFSASILTTHSGTKSSPLLLRLSRPNATKNPRNTSTFTDNCSFPQGLIVQTDGSFGYHTSERLRFENCHFNTLELTGKNFVSILQFEECRFEKPVDIHDMDYQLGSVLTPNLEDIEAYMSHESDDGSAIAEWDCSFPDHPFEQTAAINFHSCTFRSVGSALQITARAVRGFDEIFRTDKNILITFENNISADGKHVQLTYDN